MSSGYATTPSKSADDPSDAYTKARKLVSTVEFQLQQLEQEGMFSDVAEDRRHALADNLNHLTHAVNALDRAVNDPSSATAAAANAGKRELWRKRVAGLQSDAASLRRSVETYLRATYHTVKSQKEREERHRLLGSASASETSTQATVAVDSMLAERASLASSLNMVSDFTNLAGNVLGSLKSQRSVLKSAHKRALDIASNLGLSSSIIRLVERRTSGDRIIVYGGMLIILMVLLLVWWWIR